MPDNLRLGFGHWDFFGPWSLRHWSFRRPYIPPGGCTAVTPVTMLAHNYIRGTAAVTLPLQPLLQPLQARRRTLGTIARAEAPRVEYSGAVDHFRNRCDRREPDARCGRKIKQKRTENEPRYGLIPLNSPVLFNPESPPRRVSQAGSAT